MKLGSLFDGSGGFPLSGYLCGIEPVWASEVEPYPIAVTKSRFPNMKHLGDISKVSGADVEPVDIITFGSPCQDLSVAGKRAGLKHEDNGDDETTRSGLFIEAVRIIKEMREATNGEYPKYCIWENVPGAFSSNKGEDFRIVLEELIKVVEPTAVMPEVPKNGWAYADSYCGDGWSLAYRVLDAQYIRTAQRRKRIYLVLDLGGQRARKILFEREGLRGYSSESGEAWQRTSSNVEGSVGTDDREGAFGFDRYNQCSTGEKCETLRTPGGGDNYPTVCYGISSYESNAMKSDNPHSGIYEADTSRTLDGNGGNPACNQGGIAVVEAVGVDIYNTKVTGDKTCPLTAEGYTSTGTCPKVMVPVSLEPGIAAREGGHIYEGVSGTLRANAGDNQMAVAYGVDAYNQTLTGDKAKTINSSASDADHIPCAVYAVDQGGGKSQANVSEELAPTLTCTHGGEPAICYAVATQQGGAEITQNGVCPTITAAAGMSGNNQPWICKIADEHILDDQGGQQITVRDDGKSPTLRAEMHGNVPCVIGFQRQLSGVETQEDTSPTLLAAAGGSGNNKPCVAYSIENHPNDSRVKIDDEGKVQALTSRMGTGGGNVPMVMEPVYSIDRESYNCGYEFDRDPGISEDGTVPTVIARGPSAVAYSFDPGASRDVGALFIEETGKTITNGTCPEHRGGVVIARPVLSASKASFFMNADEELASTLVATDYKDPQLVAFDTAKRSYIVRRLTPTECARLQGFPDKWGDVDTKAEFTDEEYRFWLEVRKTHDRINGRKEKDYTEKQMLTWYNKLHTDSAEYKMWGNGIALPCALYVMQGIEEGERK